MYTSGCVVKTGEDMKISGTIYGEFQVSKTDLAYALMQLILEKLQLGSDFDDVGCDWVTDENYTFIGSRGWMISDRPDVATLVDAMNILKYDVKLAIDKDQE
jgi:hypothetical protein